MLRWEIRKLCTRFTLLSVLILMILNLTTVLLLYGEEGTAAGAERRDARAELIGVYHRDRAAYDRLYTDYMAQENEYEEWLINGEGSFVWNNRLIDQEDYGDRQLWRDILAQIDRSENYHADLDRVLREAYARLRELGEQRGKYAYEYQVNLILHYEKLAGTELPVDDVRGWNEYFALSSPIIFLTMAVILIGVQLFLNEKQARFTGILHVCRYGETRTRLAKIGALFCIIAILTLAFTLLPLGVLAVTTGLSDTGQAVQTLERFEFCPWELSIRQVLLLITALRVLTFFVLGLVTTVLGLLTGSFAVTVGSMLVFLAVNAALPAGFFTAAFGAAFFERYRALNLFGKFLPSLTFCLILLFAAAVGAMIPAMLCPVNLREYRWIGKIGAFFSHLRSIGLRSRTKENAAAEHAHTLLGWELRKLVWNPRSMALLLVLFAIRCGVQSYTLVPTLSGDMVVYNRYTAEIAALGGTTAAAEPYITEEAEYLAETAAEYKEAVLRYRAGAISAEEFQAVNSRNHYAEHVSGGFTKLTEKQAYLRMQSERYDAVGYVDEEGVDAFLFQDFDVFFAFAVIFLFSSLFSGEYQSGFAAIQRLTKNGRSETSRAKLSAAVITVSVLWFFFTAADLWIVFRRFPMNGLGFSVRSVQEFAEIGWDLPVWAYMVLCRLGGLFGSVLLTVLAAGISLLSGQNLKSILVLFMLLLTPYLLSTFGMTLFDSLSGGQILYPFLPRSLYGILLYAVAAFVLIRLGVRKWNGGRSGKQS